MSKQSNKTQKQARRRAYIKRKRKADKAPKPAAAAPAATAS
jgi:hypothetical protein